MLKRILFVIISLTIVTTNVYADKTALPNVGSLELPPLDFNKESSNEPSIDWSEFDKFEKDKGRMEMYKEYAAIGAALIVFLVVITLLVKTMLKTSSGDQVSFRVLVVISLLWFFMGLAIIEPYQYSEYSGYDNLKKFIYRAIVPLIVIWGFVWVKKSINEASI